MARGSITRRSVDKLKIVISAMLSSGDENAAFQSLSAANADIGQLVAALDAAGFDISNVGELDADALSAGSLSFDKLGQFDLTEFSFPSRSADTVYQNTDDVARFVAVTGKIDGDGSARDYYGAIGVAASTDNLTDYHSIAQLYGYTDKFTYRHTAVVPPGYYYELVTLNTDISVPSWQEAKYQ